MWQQDFEVVHQMPHTVVNSTGRQEQDSLLVSEPFLRRLFVDVHGVGLPLSLRIGLARILLLSLEYRSHYFEKQVWLEVTSTLKVAASTLAQETPDTFWKSRDVISIALLRACT